MPLPDDILEPISDDNPVGEDVRYDVVYDEIRDAREEVELPRQDGTWDRKPADFKQIVKVGTQVLTERSKDLQIAGWLTEAKLRREGFAGLREGLDLMRELAVRFWDDVYPPIDDDGDLSYRATPFDWVGNNLETAVKRVPLNEAGHDWFDYSEGRTMGTEEEVKGNSERTAQRNQAIAEGKLPPEDFDQAFKTTGKDWYKNLVAELEGSKEALDALEAEAQERFEELPSDDRPSFRELREALDDVGRVAHRLLETKLEQDPDPPGTEASAVTDAGGGATDAGGGEGTDTASASPAPSGGLSLEPRSRDDAARLVGAAARFLRRDDPKSPAPYLLLRGLRWGEMRAGGEDVDPRALAAPPTDTRTRLKSLLLDGDWAGLLDAAEEVMATAYGRGWLDLQRYVLTALDGLGSEYERVAKAIRSDLAELLRDLPRLPEMTLMDDSPTANRETQRWLLEEGIFEAYSEDTQEELESAGRRRPTPTVRDVRERALEKVRTGQPRKGIELLLDAADQERSERDRFLRRSEATRIMVESDLHPVAEPILRDMLARIERHDLEEWEAGETIAQPLSLLWQCLERSGGDPGQKQDLYLRVCRLDPMQAITFSSGAGQAGAEAEAPSAAPGAEAGGDAEP